MFSIKNSSSRRNIIQSLGIIIVLFASLTSYSQVGINGPTSVIANNSYTYTPSYNGSSTYTYNGWYYYSITGGVITGTTNTSKDATCTGILYSISLNVTWTAGSGSLSFSSGLGGKTISIVAAPTLVPGTISPSTQNTNYGTAPLTPLTGPGATGGAPSPSYTYAWWSSPDGSTWSSVGVATQNFTPPLLYTSTYYRRQVTENTTSSVAYSNSVFVGVYPGVTCTISPGTQNINAGTSAGVLTASPGGGNGSYSYQWQYSPNNSTWTNVGTASTYSPGVLYTTSYYRVNLLSNGAPATSNTAIINTCSTPAGQITGPSECVNGSTIQLVNATSGGSWSSSNANIATVSSSGVVTGKATGAATITYTLTNACGTSFVQLGITVVDFSAISNGLGTGIQDPLITDTISLIQGTVKTTQFQQDTLYSAAHDIKNVIALKVIEESNKYIPGDFVATAVLKVEYGHSSTAVYQIDSIKLSVTYNKSQGTKYNALNYFTFDNAEFIQVTVLRIEAPTTVNGTSFDTKQVLLLTNMLAGSRYYKLADNKKPVLSYTNPPAGSTPDALLVNWMLPVHTLHNAVQLEWAWLENEMSNSYIVNNVFDTSLLFGTSSTRIDLPGGAAAGNYKIPMLYGGAGNLFMRARAVNNMPSGSRSDGPWSGVQSYAFNGHSDSLNWQATTTYAEEGKRKTVISYYDGSLRSRQTVTKDNTTETTIVAETLYDGQGRPAIQILPAPGINSILKYNRNLNKFNSQPDTNPLDYFDFTTPALGKYATMPLITSSGTARYYSSQNSDTASIHDKNIPLTNGFPYSVTRYTPDATGRVMRQGGVGDSMQIDGNHATKYFYGSAGPEELSALFGTEVGNNTHYFKNMVQDPNGQMSVSYVDMHGRTIATALAGESPVNLQALNISDTGSYKNQAGKVIVRNLLSKATNVLKNNSIESINAVLVPFQTLYTFNYQLPAQTLQLPKCDGGTVSFPNKFDLQIAVTDESGDTDPVVFNYTGISSINFQQGLTLPAGSYSVRKSLTVNQDSLEKFIQQYETIGIGICQTQQSLIDSITAADSLASNCGVATSDLTAVSCLASLGTYTAYQQNYVTKLGLSSVNQLSAAQVNDIRNQYFNDSSLCASLNANISHTLENIRSEMLADMVPYSGQYAKETGSGTMFSKFNIFSASGHPDFTQPFYKYPRQIIGGSPDYYLNQFNNIDDAVQHARLQTMSESDFSAEFKSSWSKSLLPYHPEFKKLKFAEDTFRIVFNYIDSLHASVNTAFSPINTDPFFSVFSTGADKNLIKKYSDTSWQGGNSMWQLAYAEAFGCKTNIDTTIRKDCYANMPKQLIATGSSVNDGSGSLTLTASMQSTAWAMYKSFYGQVRSDMVNKYISLRPGYTDTLDNGNLISQGFRLHFPYNNVQQAQNNGWATWYPDQNGVFPLINVADSAKAAATQCNSYINSWRQTLLDCPSISGLNPSVRDQILNSITSKMLQVCKYGIDPANPYGSSTVAPTYNEVPFISFEQAINFVLDSAGIQTSELCNPYSIQFPKPYGKNPVITKQYIASVDTCHCSQFYKLQNEISVAGYNPSNLTSINQYLFATYQDTLSFVLYQSLQQCGSAYLYNCRDTVYTNCGHPGSYFSCTVKICDTLHARPLSTPQILPVFLNCGFDKSNFNCYSCGEFKTLDSSFYSIFGKHPVLSGTLTNDTVIAYNVLFAKYVNFKTGLQHNWQYYADRFNVAECAIGGIAGIGSGLSICLDRSPLNDTTGLAVTILPCEQVRNRATVKADIIFEYNRSQTLANFRTAYLTQCLAASEQFTVTDTTKEYHYTLYYYDQAGNLVKTVPPKGVNPIYRQSWLDSVEVAKTNGTVLVPQHYLATRYCYNSLNQVVIQKSPDGGVSKMYYDRLGRLALSQNAKQAGSGNVYSYTQFDLLGRITEIGQLTGGSAMTDATAKSESGLQSWLSIAANTRNQITQTGYDVPYGYNLSTFPNGVLSPDQLSQQHLRNRVSFSQVLNNAIDTYASSATHYSYDIHGNVDTLLQDFGYGQSGGILNAMNTSGNRFKKIIYDYDLVSGKVNQVSYQPGKIDAYYHRYSYDAENRLTDVYSGRDSVMLFFFPEREAKYTYYKHGPLASTELGQLRVQSLDFVYTIQGWLKAINPVMGGTLANGNDTTEVYPVTQDAYGFSLNYYKNDYRSIFYSPSVTGLLGSLTTNAAPLYNGNIAAMAVNIPQLGASKVYNYKYDQLNRLVSMDIYNGLNVNTGVFTPVSTTEYQERISYDPNGNILTYQRNGDAARLSMDNLSYTYKPNTNQLHKVTDATADASPSDYNKYNDLRQGQSDNNYQYDEIGNMISDAKDTISNISWTLQGKMQSVTKNGQQIKYAYDASGNRIFKMTASDTTSYVRDASGNVVSTYTKTISTNIKQTEIHLYGIARLGIKSQQSTTDTTISLNGGFLSGGKRLFGRGEKIFELNNHLGSVLVTVSDKKLGADPNSSGMLDYYIADVLSASDYTPFGTQMVGKTFNSSDYKYGFGGHEKSSEVKGEGNSYTAEFWEFDPRLGRRWNRDPKPISGISEYSVFANNPIWFVDPKGDTLRGVNASSASTQLSIAQNTFTGHADIQSLFKLNSDGLTFAAIDKTAFNNAIVNKDIDVQNAAIGLYQSISSTATQYVSYITSIDLPTKGLSSVAGLSPAILSAVNAQAPTIYDLNTNFGGAMNLALPGKQSLSIINTSSSFSPNDIYNDKGKQVSYSIPLGAVFFHEVLGHGLGGILNTADQMHKDAIQFENVYYRVMGLKIQRSGANHPPVSTALSKGDQTNVPTYIQGKRLFTLEGMRYDYETDIIEY